MITPLIGFMSLLLRALVFNTSSHHREQFFQRISLSPSVVRSMVAVCLEFKHWMTTASTIHDTIFISPV